MRHIAVLGAGAWGTALAAALAARPGGAAISLWSRDAAAAAAMAEQRCNTRYLPHILLPDRLSVGSDLASLRGADLYVLATPVAGLRDVAQQLASLAPSSVVWLCKGLEADTLALPHHVVAQALPGVACGVLSGPSFAAEVARGQPCALVLASHDRAFAESSAAAIHGGALRVYTSADVVGVEVAGAVKNVMAIATGLCDGLLLGLNARAALVTRGLAEITRLGIRMGAEPASFMGLAGVGDLLLTCTGDLSRNRQVGVALGQGGSLADVLAHLGHVAEGVNAARAVRTLAAQLAVEMPITDAVCRVLFEQQAPQLAMHALLARERGSE